MGAGAGGTRRELERILDWAVVWGGWRRRRERKVGRAWGRMVLGLLRRGRSWTELLKGEAQRWY